MVLKMHLHVCIISIKLSRGCWLLNGLNKQHKRCSVSRLAVRLHSYVPLSDQDSVCVESYAKLCLMPSGLTLVNLLLFFLTAVISLSLFSLLLPLTFDSLNSFGAPLQVSQPWLTAA